MSKGRVGVKEVAEEAGVSVATVSRALRGLHHVNDETRLRIIEAAEKLKYPISQTSDRKSTRLNSSHSQQSRMPSSA